MSESSLPAFLYLDKRQGQFSTTHPTCRMNDEQRCDSHHPQTERPTKKEYPIDRTLFLIGRWICQANYIYPTPIYHRTLQPAPKLEFLLKADPKYNLGASGVHFRPNLKNTTAHPETGVSGPIPTPNTVRDRLKISDSRLE